ncbi:uncharacterized protein LOC100902482 [Galendromus occidentalis]|uniref:Uncharacterized protein LOC100902482 n=1 Tax=Galendromus occidentalis TaxID=34638 RepID=A0AAJ6VVM0_9ACAR|nr:uncharacterized protein LOC100902482 [Galendromus occidentalis]
MFRSRLRQELRLGDAVLRFQRYKSDTARPSFTREQQSQVLSLLNSGSEKELKKYVGLKKLKLLMDYREKFGAFDTLDSLLDMEGVRSTDFDKLCTKILMSTDKSLMILKGISPKLTEKRLKGIKIVASVDVDAFFGTYVTMDLDAKVIGWGSFVHSDESDRKTKIGLYEIYTKAVTIYEKLPSADIFLMESKSERPNAASVSEKELQTMLYTMLSFGEPDQPKVAQIAGLAFSNYYNLTMGSDQVSCQETFLKLVDDARITLSDELGTHYKRQNGVSREFLALNTLRCLAFLKATRILRMRKS